MNTIKKTIIAISIITSLSALANDTFFVVIDKKDNSYIKGESFENLRFENWSEWIDVNTGYNCSTFTPDVSSILKDTSFTQESTCKQDQSKSRLVYKKIGNEPEEYYKTETESQTISIIKELDTVGTYIPTSCNDIVQNGWEDGDKIYETSKGNVFCDMDYKDGSGFERTHIFKPNQMLLGGCTSWTDTRAEFCSNYTDNVTFALDKTSEAYIEFVTYNYSNVAHDSNTSIITVDGINVSYSLSSPVLHNVNLSSKNNGNKIMTIRFTHDAGNPGDNNMGVRDIYLYEK